MGLEAEQMTSWSQKQSSERDWKVAGSCKRLKEPGRSHGNGREPTMHGTVQERQRQGRLEIRQLLRSGGQWTTSLLGLVTEVEEAMRGWELGRKCMGHAREINTSEKTGTDVNSGRR